MTGVLTDDGSLIEVVSQHTRLVSFGPEWWRATCPLPACGDEEESLTLFPSDGVLLFDCANCGHQGDIGDFKAAMDSTNGRTPERLGGAAVLGAITAFIRRYMALNNEQADLVALWVVHTHAFDAADVTPYLDIKSVEKRSGKTRLLEVLALLVARAWL
jgi:Zn ribbon nucleic-acid-binding protein